MLCWKGLDLVDVSKMTGLLPPAHELSTQQHQTAQPSQQEKARAKPSAWVMKRIVAAEMGHPQVHPSEYVLVILEI